jgi:hypothetical protein
MYTNVFRGRLRELAIVLVCMAVFLAGLVWLIVLTVGAFAANDKLLGYALASLLAAWICAGVTIANMYVEHLERRSSAYWAGKGGAR